jgi:DNA-binding XRE family transcriptional regulator
VTGTEYAEERKRLRLSQTELAQQFRVSRITIGRIEAMDEVPALYEKALRHLMASADAR